MPSCPRNANPIMSTPSISAKTLDKLAKYDTPTICNVIELFDIRPNDVGYMDARIRSAFPEFDPVVGFAATAKFSSTAAAGAYATLQEQLTLFEQLPGPAFVVFQDVDEPSIGATFGEVMCSTYQAFGTVGLITSGGGRDLLQVKALGYPVFTGTTICSHAYCQIFDVGRPVNCRRVGGEPRATCSWRREWCHEHSRRTCGRNRRRGGGVYRGGGDVINYAKSECAEVDHRVLPHRHPDGRSNRRDSPPRFAE